MNEFDIVDEYFSDIGSASGVELGIGDDAAVLAVPEDVALVVSADMLVESVHFPHDMAAVDIGWRALASNLSDTAAMGARPRWFTLTISMPELDPSWLSDFSSGLRACAERYSVGLVGGDITRGPLTLSITVLAVQSSDALTRSGARAGDGVFVSGTLGGAAAALANHPTVPNTWIDRFARPQPRIELGEALIGVASAAIDVSDGLLADLGHICRASNCGARVLLEDVPVADGLKDCFPERWADWALTGGDDYELCFTVPSVRIPKIEALAQRVGLSLSRIGTIEAAEGVRLDPGAADWRPTAQVGYRHF